MTIGDRIKTRRQELNISQTELSLRSGSSKQTIYKYENNLVTNIPSDKIEIIANILETTPAYLMGWDAQEPASPEPNTLAAHFEGDEFTDEELEEIANFVKFVKAKRNN